MSRRRATPPSSASHAIFSRARLLHEGEESNYELQEVCSDSAPLYEHCVRSIHYGLRYGEHGLPLIGWGDWSDGMNLVGIGGKGESVWLAFFLFAVLTRFAPVARQYPDPEFADLCESEAAKLRERIEASGVGRRLISARMVRQRARRWARRAMMDARSIRSRRAGPSYLTQPDPDRARRAMEAVDRLLMRRDTRLVQLLDPPFDTSKPFPGYVQGYVPGVHEKGRPIHACGDLGSAWQAPIVPGNCSRC